MNPNDVTFQYDEIAYVRKIFSHLYTQLFLQVSADRITDEALDELGDLEERLISLIKERACH
jgi:hypothetical protein